MRMRLSERAGFVAKHYDFQAHPSACWVVLPGQSRDISQTMSVEIEGKVDSKGLSKPLTVPSRPWPRPLAELSSRQPPRHKP